MGLFGPEFTREVVVDEPGLARLVRSLHWNNPGIVGAARGVGLTIFAQSRGTFLVRLTRRQESILREAMRSYEFDDVFGPGARGDADGS
jgi:hypothetical protein